MSSRIASVIVLDLTPPSPVSAVHPHLLQWCLSFLLHKQSHDPHAEVGFVVCSSTPSHRSEVASDDAHVLIPLGMPNEAALETLLCLQAALEVGKWVNDEVPCSSTVLSRLAKGTEVAVEQLRPTQHRVYAGRELLWLLSPSPDSVEEPLTDAEGMLPRLLRAVDEIRRIPARTMVIGLPKILTPPLPLECSFDRAHNELHRDYTLRADASVKPPTLSVFLHTLCHALQWMNDAPLRRAISSRQARPPIGVSHGLPSFSPLWDWKTAQQALSTPSSRRYPTRPLTRVVWTVGEECRIGCQLFSRCVKVRPPLLQRVYSLRKRRERDDSESAIGLDQHVRVEGEREPQPLEQGGEKEKVFAVKRLTQYCTLEQLMEQAAVLQPPYSLYRVDKTNEPLSFSSSSSPSSADNCSYYRYGHTWVPAEAICGQWCPTSKSVAPATRSLLTLGFIHEEDVSPFLCRGGGVKALLPLPGSSEPLRRAQVGFAAFATAMKQKRMVALVRLVQTSSSRPCAPTLGVLSVPVSDESVRPPDYLVLTSLPFHEDVRPMAFPSLSCLQPSDAHHRTDAQKEALRVLVDSMIRKDHASAAPPLHPTSSARSCTPFPFNPACQRFFELSKHKLLCQTLEKMIASMGSPAHVIEKEEEVHEESVAMKKAYMTFEWWKRCDTALFHDKNSDELARLSPSIQQALQSRLLCLTAPAPPPLVSEDLPPLWDRESSSHTVPSFIEASSSLLAVHRAFPAMASLEAPHPLGSPALPTQDELRKLKKEEDGTCQEDAQKRSGSSGPVMINRSPSPAQPLYVDTHQPADSLASHLNHFLSEKTELDLRCDLAFRCVSVPPDAPSQSNHTPGSPFVRCSSPAVHDGKYVEELNRLGEAYADCYRMLRHLLTKVEDVVELLFTQSTPDTHYDKIRSVIAVLRQFCVLPGFQSFPHGAAIFRASSWNLTEYYNAYLPRLLSWCRQAGHAAWWVTHAQLLATKDAVDETALQESSIALCSTPVAEAWRDTGIKSLPFLGPITRSECANSGVADERDAVRYLLAASEFHHAKGGNWTSDGRATVSPVHREEDDWVE